MRASAAAALRPVSLRRLGATPPLLAFDDEIALRLRAADQDLALIDFALADAALMLHVDLSRHELTLAGAAEATSAAGGQPHAGLRGGLEDGGPAVALDAAPAAGKLDAVAGNRLGGARRRRIARRVVAVEHGEVEALLVVVPHVEVGLAEESADRRHIGGRTAGEDLPPGEVGRDQAQHRQGQPAAIAGPSLMRGICFADEGGAE